MEDAIDPSLFLREHNNPVPAKVVGAVASRTSQWKRAAFEKTPAGCPIPKEGELWDPVIGAGPFRPYMVPKRVPVADGVLVMMRLYYQLPFNISGITLAELQEIEGFSQTGKIQPEVVEERRYNGSTVYDVDGKIMTIDEVVMRGNNASDARRRPGSTNETNFLKPGGLDKQLWFNRLFNGADTSSPGGGAAFAQQCLTDYGYYIHKDNQRLNLNGPRVDASKQERSKQYYAASLFRRNEPLETTSPIKPKSATSLTLRLNMKPKPVEAQAVLVETNEDKDCGESELSDLSESSEEEMAIALKQRKLIPRSAISARVNDTVAASFGDPRGDKNNEESNEKVVSALTNSFAELEAEKALKTLEPLPPAPTNSITSAPVETTAERAAKVKKELAVRAKEMEDMMRELKEIEEKEAAEKAAIEKAAAEKAAAEKAAVEKEAAEKAATKLAKKNADLNRRAAGKSLKHMGESVKHMLSAYHALRMADAADKTLVAKLDEELAPYFLDALNDTAREPQKRKFKEEEGDDKRPAKIAKE
jgi:hypothetical protein